MLKPVSILALDDIAAPLARAAQQRIVQIIGVDDLVQMRAVADDLAQTIHSIHAQRQHPDSPLRVRDDISTRELVLVMLSAAGPARSTLIETTRQIREIYETRRFASFLTIEILCLLPEVAGATGPEDYAAAYALLKALSDDDTKPFDEVWLLDSTNGSRVRFGALDASLDAYADAIAGALTYEPEMSGALPGIHPRGMHPTFSSFGYASLVFPREAALQRIEPRFAAELIRTKLLDGEAPPHAQLLAKQFVVADAFATPLARIGVEAGHSLFRRFQPKAQANERTRSAEEIIAAVRSELQTFRDSTHLKNLETLARQGEETTREFAALLGRAVDETLDRDGYQAAQNLLAALIDPLPELRMDADLAPRNLVTEIRGATSALDARLRFTANTVASDGARQRIRELETLTQDQKLVVETVASVSGAEQIAEMEREKSTLLQQVPEIMFAEERENNAARNAARNDEAARLAAETEAWEQELRELFAQLPRVEQALREALETRRTWLRRQVLVATAGVAAAYATTFLLDVLRPHVERITWAVIWGVALFALLTGFRYMTQIVPLVREARERLVRVRAQIETTDQANNAAHNAELQFEYDVAHRRTTLRVLRAMRDTAKDTRDAVHAREQELEEMVASFVPASIVASGLSMSIVDNAEIDAWYERTIEDRKPFEHEFPITRSASRRLALEEIRRNVSTYAMTAFVEFRKLTLATAATSLTVEAKLTQRLKRFVDISAPLIEIRDDDLQAQRAMQRDCTLWVDANDAAWTAQLQRRFPEAHVKSAPDPLCVHAVTRVLHYPGYVLGQIEYYRAQYEAHPDGTDVADLLPAELIVGAHVRDAYEQVLLARALGIVVLRDDGSLAVSGSLLGDSHLMAAQMLASQESASSREQLHNALIPRLEMTADVSRELRSLRQSTPLTPLDRNVLDGLLKKYATLV
jgi:hypothetical protein